MHGNDAVIMVGNRTRWGFENGHTQTEPRESFHARHVQCLLNTICFFLSCCLVCAISADLSWSKHTNTQLLMSKKTAIRKLSRLKSRQKYDVSHVAERLKDPEVMSGKETDTTFKWVCQIVVRHQDLYVV